MENGKDASFGTPLRLGATGTGQPRARKRGLFKQNKVLHGEKTRERNLSILEGKRQLERRGGNYRLRKWLVSNATVRDPTKCTEMGNLGGGCR